MCVSDVKCECKIGYIGDGYSCTGNLLQVLSARPTLSNFLSVSRASLFDCLFFVKALKLFYVTALCLFLANPELLHFSCRKGVCESPK